MKLSFRQDAAIIVLAMLVFNLIPHKIVSANTDEIVYPLKVISKLDCRFEDFESLSSKCKEALPILHTKDYAKYATKNGWYNDYTRLYTVLWGSSYKYGWDVWSGWHQGTDIATAKWTPVYSMAQGKVINSGNDVGWGKFISVEHNINGKKIVSNYAHLSKISVNTGERVNAWEKIWEVWSTGNSTWNHLHFQIDLPHSFHPYYYDWNSCPYSYYKITEEGVCFDELARKTIDPLAFLESNGAILDEIKISDGNNYSSSKNTTNTSVSQNIWSQATDIDDIFTLTLYYGYGESQDVKALQKLMKRLSYYNGEDTGEYADIEKAVIKFQLEHNVIADKNDDGAGWFGPKTRAAAKIAYDTYLDTRKVGFETNTQDERVTVSLGNKINKVSRENLLTREEIQAQEMSEFLKKHTIEIKNSFSQIATGQSKLSVFSITDRQEKWFRGNTPGNVTFQYDETKLSIFPKSFYNFTDGTREITITGLSEGYTSVDVKIWEVIVETLWITVGKQGSVSEVKSAKIYANNSITLWEEGKAVVLLKDQYSNKLIGKKYSWEFMLSSENNILYCVKRGKVQDIKEIYARDCFPEEYTADILFTYDDTLGGLLIFDYKVLDSNANIYISRGNTNIAQKNIAITQIKNLSKNYEYYNEVLQGVMSGLVDGIDRGYFSQDAQLREHDAKQWILSAMEQWNYSQEEKNKLRYTPVNTTKNITREAFLHMTYTHLWNNKLQDFAKDYKDLEEGNEVLVASLLWSEYQWRDDFGQQYFQPNKEISRGEAVYMLTKALENMWKDFLVQQ